jgi:hypothetical protein
MRHSALSTFAIAFAMAFAIGCHTQSTPVPFRGDPVSITRLAGSWTGEYWGGAAGRGGSLAFTLRSGTDSLFGDVTMVSSTGQPLRPADPVEAHRAHVQTAQQLRIDFVAAQADSVRGTLEPYISPDCECIVGTAFVGQVHGDAISGTFETRNAGRVIATGRWEMHRVGGR